MRYPEALAYLDSFANYEKQPPSHYGRRTYSLRRMVELMDALERPQERYPTIHIAGSKGKGSSAAMMDSILRCAGRKVGLYSSPHLMRFGERVKVDGTELGWDELVRLVEELAPFLETFRGKGVTYFEAVTAMALLHFARKKVDVAVLEVGLGGRLDATNVVRPACSCITTLDLEHTDRLGNTLLEIAGEKAGVIKRGVPCVTTCLDSACRGLFEERTRDRRARVRLLEKDFFLEAVEDGRPLGRSSIAVRGESWEYSDLEIGLLGWHQRINAAGVVAMVEQLKKQGERIEEGAVRGGLQSVVCEGRLQKMEGMPLVVMDCAHSRISAQCLRQSMEEMFEEWRPKIGLVGFLKDKDYPAFLEALSPVMDGWVVTEPDSPRARGGEEVLEFLTQRYGKKAQVRSAGDALCAAKKDAGPGGMVLVTGSMYLVGEMLRQAGKREVEEAESA